MDRLDVSRVNAIWGGECVMLTSLFACRDHALCRLQEIGFTVDDMANALKEIPFVSGIHYIGSKTKANK